MRQITAYETDSWNKFIAYRQLTTQDAIDLHILNSRCIVAWTWELNKIKNATLPEFKLIVENILNNEYMFENIYEY